jgi:hypothetical protein
MNLRYILLEYGFFKHMQRKIMIVSEDKFHEVYPLLRYKYNAREVCKPPSKRTLRRWKRSNRGRAICGCWVPFERGERCYTHNAMSWLSASYNLRK